MLVSDVRVVSSGLECEIQARVKSDASRRPFLILYRFPREFEGFVSAENGDPFIPALLLPAMKAHEPLEITAPVSPRLLRSVDAIQRIYRSWDSGLSEVEIKAPVREKPLQRVQERLRVGLFFSCGVDSYYSLLKNVQDHPADEETITDLIVVHGFNVVFGRRNSGVFRTVLANARKAGQELRKNVVPVATNLKDFGDRFADWSTFYHGAFLASVGLCLESVIDKICIASSHYDSRLTPWGSHPALDPLWSTERLSLAHDSPAVGRVEKIRFIAKFPFVMETLHVCTVRAYSANVYNCGLCEKCLRTLVGLYIAGMLKRCTTLPNFIDIGLLRTLSVPDENVKSYTEELINALGSSETDLLIKLALEERLGSGRRSFWRHVLTTLTYLNTVYAPTLLPAWNRLRSALTTRSPRYVR